MLTQKKINNIDEKNLEFIKLIGMAYTANEKAHEYSEKSQSYYHGGDHEGAREYSDKKSECYSSKNKFLIQAIKFLKKNKLKYKYGISDGILYVVIPEIEVNTQFSFHVFDSFFKNIKKYNGKWSNRPHLK